MRFGSSGVRGPWGEHVTVASARRLGRAVGADRGDVLVARDGRTSSPVLAEALAAGLMAQGADVTRGGVASTPAVAAGASDHDAAVGVTASHNPAGDGGFKLWQPTGQGFDAIRRERVTELLGDPPAPASWDAVGSGAGVRDLAREHVDRVLDLEPSRELGLRVAVDGGNGPAGRETARVLRAMGCEVVTLNAQVDGAFPGRPSEPTPANLTDLRALVTSSGMDLGVAHDGDGDRLVVVTADGDVVAGDALLVLLARGTGARSVVCPVDASMAVEDALDADVRRTRVGDVHVAAALAEHGGDLGGEASGCWILPDGHLAPDGPRAAAVVAALAAERPLRERLHEIPSYPLERASVPVPHERKAALVDRVAPDLATLGTVDRTDGVRVGTDDGWVLVRPSGTEPKVRVTVEARDAGRLAELRDRALDLVRAAAEGVRA